MTTKTPDELLADCSAWWDTAIIDIHPGKIAIDGACGPWSTPGTSAASSKSDCPRVGRSPRSISQIMSGNRTRPISSSIG